MKLGRSNPRGFTKVMRGYNPRQVDEYLDALERGPVTTPPQFEIVMRGYRLEEVHEALSRYI
ncbi:DivIVA domain-containing protein [Spirillospora sp. CA-255316]